LASIGRLGPPRSGLSDLALELLPIPWFHPHEPAQFLDLPEDCRLNPDLIVEELIGEDLQSYDGFSRIYEFHKSLGVLRIVA
jgi:hypothetical protein